MKPDHEAWLQVLRGQHPGDGGATAPPGWGIYILANDGVAANVEALLGSLSIFAPGVPVMIIPFDDRQDRLQPLTGRLGIGYLSTPRLEELTSAGLHFYPGDHRLAGMFRKLAAFDGPFARFLYIDADVVALTHLGPLLREIDRTPGADLLMFDVNIDVVYRPGSLREHLVTNHAATGFNAGIFAADRRIITTAEVLHELGAITPAETEHFFLYGDQPFMNFLFDRRRVPRRSAWEIVPGFSNTTWAGVGEIAMTPDGFRLNCPERWDHNRRMFFLHWAGFHLPNLPSSEVFDFFQWVLERPDR